MMRVNAVSVSNGNVMLNIMFRVSDYNYNQIGIRLLSESASDDKMHICL